MPQLPLPSSLKPHDDFVKGLAERVARFYEDKEPFRIYHGTTNSTRTSTKTAHNTLDVSPLYHVLKVFPETKKCIVEPNCPMDALLFNTMRHKLMPPVLPEFRGITVGGAFAGTAGESSSFKYGFFDRSVTWFEMILADGTIVTASPDERPDLFHGSAGTFGTLGVITLLELDLIEAEKYVELTYHPVNSITDAVSKISSLMAADKSGESPIAFLDGIMYSSDSGVVMSGTFLEAPHSPDSPVSTFYAASDPWFYLHAQSRMKEPKVDTIPLISYAFRYDRGAFWTGRHAFTYFMTPFNWLTRYLLDDFMNTRIMYHALHRSGLTNQFIIQDMATPASRMTEFSDWLDSDNGECGEIYPRWLCPLKAGESISMSPHLDSPGKKAAAATNEGEDYLLNIGLWGPLPPSSAKNQLTINRAIEKKLHELKGMKWLYAQTFYTEEEFWQIYDRKGYEQLRAKYSAQTLPSVYDKVGPRADILEKLKGRGPAMGWYEWVWETVWPLKGVYGVLSAIKGGDYLRKR